MPIDQCNSFISENEKTQRILDLKKLLQDEKLTQFPHDNAYLERFLGGTDFDVKKAFERIKTFYELLLEYPDWFTKDSPLSKKELIEKDIRLVLPDTDKNGRPIYIVKLANVNVDKMKIIEVVAVDDIWLESILLNVSTDKGLCVIIDIGNFPWKMMKWVTPHNVKMGVKKMLALPFKTFVIHVVNECMMFHTVLKLMWPFIPDYIKQMVKFHFSDRDALYAYIDPEVLPIEYGGRNTNLNNKDIYDSLFAQDQEIAECFKVYRNVEIGRKK